MPEGNPGTVRCGEPQGSQGDPRGSPGLGNQPRVAAYGTPRTRRTPGLTAGDGRRVPTGDIAITSATTLRRFVLHRPVAGGADDAVDLEGQIAARLLHRVDELLALIPQTPVRLLLFGVELDHLASLRLDLVD